MTDLQDDSDGSDPAHESGSTRDLETRLARLESLVDGERSTTGLPSQSSRDDPEPDGRADVTNSDRTPSSSTRRAFLTTGGLLAALGLGVVPASADPQGQVGTASDPLVALYTQQVGSGTGNSLSFTVSGSRALALEPASAGRAGNVVGGHASNAVEDDAGAGTIAGGGFDDGSTTEPNEVFANFGTIGGGRNNQAGNDEGNPGVGEYTTVAGGRNNVARYDNATVGGGEGNEAVEIDCTVGGGRNNFAAFEGATIGGGVDNAAGKTGGTVGGGHDNTASLEYATVAGGNGNRAGGVGSAVCGGVGNDAVTNWGFVGGGRNNTANGHYATVGGGLDNDAGSTGAATMDATVAGGRENTASGGESTVGGGVNNTASGSAATVPGGVNNTADGDFSVAAGREADTNGHDGAFVLGDSSDTPVTAEGDDEVRSQVPMYAPSFNTTSARAAKTDLEPVDPQAVLSGVESLDVATWEFTDTDDGRHVGPMADDFHDAFDLESDAESIASVDADGVAFAAIQGLAERNAELAEAVADREDRIEDLEHENDLLRDRLDSVEARLDDLDPREQTPETDGD